MPTERFEVYLPVPETPVVDSPVSISEVEEVHARVGRFVDERNRLLISAFDREEMVRAISC